jgi:UDP-N-acetylglucosamine transferase subunit ALG13
VILVTVGTHEQSFARLLREVDRLNDAGLLPDRVFCQSGYSDYEPRVDSAPMVPHHEMQARIEEASVVVTHGGPGSIMPVLAAGRPLVLVPRRQTFEEHVDDHQVAFCTRIARDLDVPVVTEMADLRDAIDTAFALGASRVTAAQPRAEGIDVLAVRIAALV